MPPHSRAAVAYGMALTTFLMAFSRSMENKPCNGHRLDLGACGINVSSTQLGLLESGISGRQLLFQAAMMVIQVPGLGEGAGEAGEVLIDTNSLIRWNVAKTLLGPGERAVANETILEELAAKGVKSRWHGSPASGCKRGGRLDGHYTEVYGSTATANVWREVPRAGRRRVNRIHDDHSCDPAYNRRRGSL